MEISRDIGTSPETVQKFLDKYPQGIRKLIDLRYLGQSQDEDSRFKDSEQQNNRRNRSQFLLIAKVVCLLLSSLAHAYVYLPPLASKTTNTEDRCDHRWVLDEEAGYGLPCSHRICSIAPASDCDLHLLDDCLPDQFLVCCSAFGRLRELAYCRHGRQYCRICFVKVVFCYPGSIFIVSKKLFKAAVTHLSVSPFCAVFEICPMFFSFFPSLYFLSFHCVRMFSFSTNSRFDPATSLSNRAHTSSFSTQHALVLG